MLSLRFSPAFQMSVYTWHSERSKNFAAVFWGLSICFIQDEGLIKLEIGRICTLCCAMLCYTILYYVLSYIYVHIFYFIFRSTSKFLWANQILLNPSPPGSPGQGFSALVCMESAWKACCMWTLVQRVCREDQGFCISSCAQVTSGLIVHRPQLSNEGLGVSNCQHISGRLAIHTVYDFNEGSLSVTSQIKYYPCKSGLFVFNYKWNWNSVPTTLRALSLHNGTNIPSFNPPSSDCYKW